jgi:hypothetical protein
MSVFERRNDRKSQLQNRRNQYQLFAITTYTQGMEAKIREYRYSAKTPFSPYEMGVSRKSCCVFFDRYAPLQREISTRYCGNVIPQTPTR